MCVMVCVCVQFKVVVSKNDSGHTRLTLLILEVSALEGPG